MRSSRHVIFAWIAIGALLAPVVSGATWAAPWARAPVPLSGSPGSVTSLFPARVPGSPNGTSGAPAPVSPPQSRGEAPGASKAISPPGPTAVSASPEILAGWDALHYGTNAGITNGWVPPDVIVSVGPTYVVEMVNLLMGVYTKTGTLVHVTDLASFFNASSDFISDPKVQYDDGSGRWFASLTDVTASTIRLAVSATSNPTGSWHLFTISGSGCLDQPILGVGSTTVIVSVNVFSSCTSTAATYVGAQYWVVRKADLLAGAASPAMYVSTPNVSESSIHPVQIEGTSSVHYMVSTYWPGALTSNTLHLFTVSGTPPSTVAVAVTSLPMATAAVPPAAPQLGSTHTIDAGDIRVSDAVWSAGSLWLGFDEACLADAMRACIRLVKIDTTAGTIVQDFDIDVAGKHVLYPGLRVDGKGDLAVVFGYTSSVDYPGIMVSGRVSGDPPAILQAPEIVALGSGAEAPASCSATCRYGDYFGAALDPSNGSVVWLAGQMGTSSGWSTHVFAASVKSELTLSYQVFGAGSGYGAPTVSVMHGGAQTNTVLGTTPTTVLADPDTTWSVTTELPGSSVGKGEVWFANTRAGAPARSGTSNASQTVVFQYFHQYAASLGFTVVGATGYANPPQVSGTVFGLPVSLATPANAFLDAGTPYAYSGLLAGSTNQERWQASPPIGGTVSAPLQVSATYHHQVVVTFLYDARGRTSVVPPQVHYLYLGGAASSPLNATLWADAPAAYAYDAALSGASASVRWGAGPNGDGTLMAPGTISVTYREQFWVAVASDPSTLAASVTGSGWFDVGSSITLSASVPTGWRFNRWTGDASGTATAVDATVQGSMSITAVFDAGLTIAAGEGGSIAYAYGSTSGTVPAGSSLTIYVPVGTTLTLTGVPASWSQAFEGWSGAASGTSAGTTLQVNGPGTVAGSFGLNIVTVGGVSLLAGLVFVAGVVVLVLRRARRPPLT